MDTKILFRFSAMLGSLYVLFIIWLRLIRERLPKDITGNYDTFIYILYVSFLILSLCMFLYYIRKILNIQPKYKILKKVLEIPLIHHIADFIVEYILNAPYNFYIWMCNKININKIIEEIGRHLWNWNQNPDKDPKMIAIFLCILKLIISLCFILDIIIFHKFNYFYKSLILLFVILMFNSIIFILKDISTFYRNHISTNYIFVEANETKDAFYLEFQPLFNGERTDTMLHVHFTIWVRYTANCMFADKFYEYYHKYNNYTSVIYYGIFSLGWGYIIL